MLLVYSLVTLASSPFRRARVPSVALYGIVPIARDEEAADSIFNTSKNKRHPDGCLLFLVEMTRFELATSTSRT